MYSPMASLPLRLPSPMTLRKSYKDTKRASKVIRKHLGNGTLKSVSKCENRTIVTFYITGHRVDWHNWGFNYQTNKQVREQPAITYAVSHCTALAPIALNPTVVTMLETDFAY